MTSVTMLQSPCKPKTIIYKKEILMKKDVKIKINKRNVVKKLEKIALEKYSSNEELINPRNICLGETTFTPANDHIPFCLPKESLPYNHRKVKCSSCENIIIVPLGYNHCPKCGRTIYVDKSTVSLM